MFSQVSIEWVARYDGGYGDDAGLAIAADDSGYVYVTGNSYGTLTRQDLVVLKYSKTGVNQWARRIADTVNNDFRSGFDIKLNNMNDILIGGIGVFKYDRFGNLLWSTSQDVRFEAIVIDKSGNVFATGGASTRFITRKFQPNGIISWTQKYQYLSSNISRDITIDKNEDVAITGQSAQTLSLYDYMTIKYSNFGNSIWERRYDGGNEDAAYAITSDDSNNVYVTGWNRNNTTDILTIKYSSEGDTIWKAVYDGGGFDVGYDIEVDSLGCVYVGGVTNSSSYVTIKYDINGNMLWSEIQPSQLIPYFPKLKLDKNRNVYMSFVSYRPGLYSNYAVVKYNTEGIQQWVAEYNNGGVSLNYIYNLAVDDQANVYVTGKSDGGHGYSIATVKFIQSTTHIDPLSLYSPESIRLEQNYPNPFNPSTYLEFRISKLGFVSLKVYDILGKEVKTLVYEIKPAGTYKVEFDGKDLSGGVYYYRLVSGKFTQVRKMLLLK
ncbi:MAG TPA: SBBP repeat-containing protein [Ignavibacteria bacterium]|nr:SBBP repeat-containing protein [Ignavibacteria bacterium]